MVDLKSLTGFVLCLKSRRENEKIIIGVDDSDLFKFCISS